MQHARAKAAGGRAVARAGGPGAPHAHVRGAQARDAQGTPRCLVRLPGSERACEGEGGRVRPTRVPPAPPSPPSRVCVRAASAWRGQARRDMLRRRWVRDTLRACAMQSFRQSPLHERSSSCRSPLFRIPRTVFLAYIRAARFCLCVIIAYRPCDPRRGMPRRSQGLCAVPLYDTLGASAVGYIVEHAELSVVMYSPPSHLARVSAWELRHRHVS